jgi:diadenosine tetraphosphatase ApaH/serine/threonine PP2A family protein phosphatase
VLYTHSSDQPIAFFGGAYGNLPALTACLKDAEANGASLNVFFGDATGCCGHSDETIQILTAQCQVRIAGNLEEQAAIGSLSCGCGYGEGEDNRLSCQAHAYSLESLSEDSRLEISRWPQSGVLATPHGRILLCHGSPDQNNEFLYESQLSDTRLTAWLNDLNCVAMACTHTGLPWIRQLTSDRVAFNAGVVGKPDHDGDPAVHYAMLRWHGGKPTVELKRVEYDHHAWVAQLRDEGVDDVFLSPLETGIWTVGVASLPEAERARSPQR